MTQHIQDFLQDCITVTADGSLASLDEVEGLYVYWCSLRKDDVLATDAVLEELRFRGLGTTRRSGVDYVEGLILTGPVVTGFILDCEFSGVWGQPGPADLVYLTDVSDLEGVTTVRDAVPVP